jgi:MerR family transcriptional regulator, heat shock protein HspR
MLVRQDTGRDFLTPPRGIVSHPHRDAGPAPNQGVYGISVAAELSGAPIQSIRLWERRGLLSPERTQGGTRRYSAADLTRIARITALAAAGVNIAGITRILDLEDANTALLTVRPPRR